MPTVSDARRAALHAPPDGRVTTAAAERSDPARGGDKRAGAAAAARGAGLVTSAISVRELEAGQAWAHRFPSPQLVTAAAAMFPGRADLGW